MIFWKKQKEMETSVEEYLAEKQKCLASFAQAIEAYFADGLGGGFEELVEKTHRLETAADAKRREIEDAMYGRALIPAARGDILGMLEAIDLVPNKAESVLHQIWLQSMTVPAEYAEDVKSLAKVNVESFDLLCDAMRHLFTDITQVLPAVAKVCDKEGESDVIERRLIKSIFDSPGDKADKILLKELVLEIGAISDRAENASDRLRIVAIKQQT